MKSITTIMGWFSHYTGVFRWIKTLADQVLHGLGKDGHSIENWEFGSAESGRTHLFDLGIGGNELMPLSCGQWKSAITVVSFKSLSSNILSFLDKCGGERLCHPESVCCLLCIVIQSSWIYIHPWTSRCFSSYFLSFSLPACCKVPIYATSSLQSPPLRSGGGGYIVILPSYFPSLPTKMPPVKKTIEEASNL